MIEPSYILLATAQKMNKYRKKICLLFCGGSALAKGGKSFEVKKAVDINSWLMNFEELSIMADIEPVFIFGGKSANVSAQEWIKLSNQIKKRIKKTDGFVILHDPQTMAYTASALSFAFQNLNKPIVLTGSPLASSSLTKVKDIYSEFKGLGIKANLLNAIQVASSGLNKVAILFGSRLIAGVQAVSAEPPGLNYFDSYSNQYLGRVDFGISLTQKTKKITSALKIKNSFDTKVSVFDYHPGVDVSLITNINKQKVHGLIIRLHHQNILPDNFITALKSLKKHKIPVVIYEAGSDIKTVKTAGFILANNMSLAATLVKLMWLLAQSKDLTKIKKLMNKNMVGEII